MEETQFEDAETYNPNFMKDKITFRDIVLQHLRKISQFASVEFRGGYWEEKEVPLGNMQTLTQRTYIPDTREVYSNAVECLADLIAPYFDAEMRKAEAKAEKDIDRALTDNTIEVEADREDETPEEARHFKTLDDKISFRSERRRILRGLFRALCCFLYRNKYLELGSIED
jgi:hypothetical protein